ncbi:MAG: OB-fold protein [Desulfobacterales bacterium]
MKPVLILLSIFLITPVAAFSGSIELKDGTVIQTLGTWEDEENVFGFVDGKVESYPKSEVSKWKDSEVPELKPIPESKPAQSGPKNNSPKRNAGQKQANIQKRFDNSAIVEVISEYKKNEYRADSLYKNKIITVRGKIVSIDKTILSQTILMMHISGFDYLHFIFNRKESQALYAISKGDVVTITGKCLGEVVGNLTFSDCRIEG